MKTLYFAIIVCLIALLFSLFLPPIPALSTTPPVGAPYISPTLSQMLLTVGDIRIQRIMRELGACESGGDPAAKNPKDLDDTPSWGLYQFKPETLYSESKHYKVLTDIEPDEIINVIFDPEIQFKTALPWISDNWQDEAFWMQQFPGCAKIYKFWKYQKTP